MKSTKDALFKDGFLQAILELASAYEENKILSERFAEKVCGLRNVYYREKPGVG
jgi:hypothetical protein